MIRQDRNENIDTPGHFSTAEEEKKETVYHSVTCCGGSCTPYVVSCLHKVEATEKSPMMVPKKDGGFQKSGRRCSKKQHIIIKGMRVGTGDQKLRRQKVVRRTLLEALHGWPGGCRQPNKQAFGFDQR